MPMHNPPHPGLTVRHDCLEPLGLTVTEGAKVLGVTRQALNNLVNSSTGARSVVASANGLRPRPGAAAENQRQACAPPRHDGRVAPVSEIGGLDIDYSVFHMT